MAMQIKCGNKRMSMNISIDGTNGILHMAFQSYEKLKTHKMILLTQPPNV